MSNVSVWAPRPDRVVAIVDGAELPTEPVGGGWWSTVDDVVPGCRYGWSLDGGAVRADPRAARLPDGVEGLGEVVDHASFVWTDGHWRAPPLGSFVFYELHIGTFAPGATFDAAIERLDHLVDLGVTAVEVMPIASFPGYHGWGYDGVGLYAPHEPYGGPLGFKRFVDACHGRGLAVVLDVVYNHLGPLGNHLAEFGPYFTDRIATPWGDAVNLDGPGSDEVRRFFIDNAIQWLRDYHVDGLRLDAVHALHDESARPFLAQLAAEVHALGAALERPLVLIAESDRNDPTLVEPAEAGGIGLDAMWADDVHHVLHVAVTGERDGYYEDYSGSVGEIADTLQHGYRFRGQYSPHRGRRHGRALGDQTPRERLVVCLQNHDQIGNRARGERLGQLTGAAGPTALAGVTALALLGPGTPLVFQGEEWSATSPFQYFTDHPDPELGRAVREGRRAEFAAFGWDPAEVPDPQDEATWRRSCLDWDELRSGTHADVLDWYRTLLHLRRTEPDLRGGRAERLRVDADEASGWVRMQRGTIVVVAQVHGTGARVALPCKRVELLAASDGARIEETTVVLPANGAVVARLLDVSGEMAAQPAEHAVEAP